VLLRGHPLREAGVAAATIVKKGLVRHCCCWMPPTAAIFLPAFALPPFSESSEPN